MFIPHLFGHQAYLMFGDEEYLDMFLEVYTSTMQYLQLPINVRSYSFLVDVNMDSGVLSVGKPIL
jgi:hypothetical protein